MLLGVSGSVAAIKAAELAALLCGWADVRMITTAVGRRFVTGQLPPGIALYGAQPAGPRNGKVQALEPVCGQLASLLWDFDQP